VCWLYIRSYLSYRLAACLCRHVIEIVVIVCAVEGARNLRKEQSSPARTQGSWIRISFKSWIFVCVYSVFVLLCVYVAAL
jgi:hypothetical protein